VPFAGVAELKDRIKQVKRALRGELPAAGPCRPAQVGLLPGPALARGDRRVADLLLKAHQADGDWAQACRLSPVNPDFFVLRLRSREELFPWDFIDHGITKDYLWQEYQTGPGRPTNAPLSPQRLPPLRRLPLTVWH
jgi:hypothetical protein